MPEFYKLPETLICNDRGVCREFNGPWPIRILFPWLWWAWMAC